MYEVLDAQKRTNSDPKSFRLRKEGWVPGVMYRPEVESSNLKLNHVKLVKCLNHGHTVLELSLDGKKQLVNIDEIQWDPQSRELLHISFKALSANRKTTMSLPLHFEGEAKGAKEGGLVTHSLDQVSVEGLPKDMPDSLVVDVTNLELHDTLHISDITLPQGLTWKESDLEKTIVSCHPPKAEVIEEPAEVEDDSPEAKAAAGEEKPEEGKEESSSEEPKDDKAA